MTVLGIEVDNALIARWRAWLAPGVQPFFVDTRRGWPKSQDVALTPELRDTFKFWRMDRSLKVVWLDEETVAGLPLTRQAELVRRRYQPLVWPSQVTDEIAVGFVEREGIASRHGEVDWTVSGNVLPRAEALVGTFPSRSGPNCFGTTMAAAGLVGAENEWMQREPFEAWLAAHCQPGGTDNQAGTVLLWRETATGLVSHSAVTLGDGLAFEKASGCWWSPRAVASVADVKRDTRQRGLRLERWRIVR
ncbi:MAG: hypothetical protein H0U92_10250 [Actinobacteria bacterium]|nr:hypothetical protein [Actinomycetota bacterium]